MHKTMAMGWGTVALVVLFALGSLGRPQGVPSPSSPRTEQQQQQQQQPTSNPVVAENMIQSTQFSLMPIPERGTIGVFIRSAVSINGFQFQLAQNDKIVPVKKCSGGIAEITGYNCIVLSDEEHLEDAEASNEYTIVAISSEPEPTDIPAAPQRFRLLCELQVASGVDGLETEQFELRNMMVISTKWTDLSPSFYSHFKPKVIEAMGSDFDAQNLEQFTTVSASEEQGDSGLSIGFSFGPNGIEYLSVYLNTQVPVSGFQFSFTDQHGEPLAVQNGFGGLCQEKNIWMAQGPSDVLMGLSAGEDSQIGPGKFLLSNFKLISESADLIRQETDSGIETYTACLADTVLSDAKGQAIQSNEQYLESKMQCFTVLRDSKTGKILASSTPTPSIGNEDLPTAPEDNLTHLTENSDESSKNELILSLSVEPLTINEMHATISVTNLKPIQKLVFQLQDDQSIPIAVKDVSLAPPYLSNRVSPLYQEQLHTSFTEGQVTVHGIESDITIPAGSGPLLQITITGDWKSLMSEGSPLKQICISDIQGLGSHGIPLSINYGFDDTPQSCAKVSSDLLSIIAMDIDTDIPTSEKGRLHRTDNDHMQSEKLALETASISAICLGLFILIVSACAMLMRYRSQLNQRSSWSRGLALDDSVLLLPHSVPTEIPICGNNRRFH